MTLRSLRPSRSRSRACGSAMGAARGAMGTARGRPRRALRRLTAKPRGAAMALPDRGDRGSSAIELAILAPIVLLIIWLSIQFAFWYQGRQVALAAAQAGARVARQEANVTAAWRVDARNAAVNYYSQLGTRVLSGRITATPIGTANTRVGVRVSGQVVSIVFGLKLTISETVSGPVECFRPDLNGGQRCG
jgi:Flp pilus assembly protein TadG